MRYTYTAPMTSLSSAPALTAMPVSSWTANTDHATALPACFAFDEHAITVFLNGGRHLLTGAVPPHEEELPYGGDGNMAVVNSDLHTVRPLLGSLVPAKPTA